MAFQNTKSKERDPVLWHSTLVKNGPKLVTVVSAPKLVKNGELCVVTLSVDGLKHGYFIDNDEIRNGFAKHVGQQVVLIATGDSRQKTARMEFQLAGVPASQLVKKEAPAARPEPAVAPVVQSDSDKGAKKYLCQAANLMRLCVKKANDIAIEMGLPNEHRQGMATTFFIQCDRRGFIETMPISPYSPEELGFGSSKAQNLAKPEPNEPEEF